MKDIANKLGISVSTVSKSLSGAVDVSDELRQTVLDTAVEMGYQPKNLRRHSSKNLCVLIQNIEYETPDTFGYDLIFGFRQMAMRDNWDVSVVPISNALQTEEPFDTFMLKNGYAGAFVAGLSLYDKWIDQFSSTAIPTVLFDNYVPGNPNVGYVGTDSYEGIDLCVSHLAKLGHTRIAFLNGIAGSMVTADRHTAFYRSMEQHGLKVNDKLVVFGYYAPDCAKYYVSDFIKSGVTAIVCASDSIAQGVIAECNRKGFRVPEDISVTGYDDLPGAAVQNPPLTTVRQDRHTLGKCAYATLSALMHAIPVSRALLRASLVTRSSTALVNPDRMTS